MASHRNPHLDIFLVILSMLTIFFSSSSSIPISLSEHPATVYEILPKFGLPSGLLPDSVKSYSLNEDGTFEVKLQNPCYIHFDYLVYYEQKITGKLSIGSITDLKGIQVQKFFFWFDVEEIRVDLPPSDSIYFQVGFINKKLDLGQFETVHSCQDNKGLALPGQSLRQAFQLPVPIDDVQMLITE